MLGMRGDILTVAYITIHVEVEESGHFQNWGCPAVPCSKDYSIVVYFSGTQIFGSPKP